MHWPEGEASLARELGKLHGFRRWCETPLVELRAAHTARESDPSLVPGPGGGSPSVGGLFRPVRLHLACKLGRRWLCLNCFGVEVGGVEAFRRARCEGVAPVAEAPRALLTAVVRYGPSAGLTGASQVRLSALWAVAGCHAAVFTLALPPERPQVPLLSTVIGQALSRGHQGSLGCLKRGPGESLSHPEGPSRLVAAAGADNRRLLKRRRSGLGSEGSQPCSQGALDALVACRSVAVASAVTAWPPRPAAQGGSGGGSSSGPSGHC